MKLIVCFLLLVAFATAADLAQLPDEITLTSGRVLKKVSVIRWEKNRVIIKYAGGADPIAFSLVAEPLRSHLPALRDAGLVSGAKAKTGATRTIGGQVFVTTRGSGAYKFSEATVVVLSRSECNRIANEIKSKLASDKASGSSFHPPDYGALRYKYWNEAIASCTILSACTTDADGYYKLTFTSPDPVTIFCTTRRLVGGSQELNVWVVPVISEDRIDLNAGNML